MSTEPSEGRLANGQGTRPQPWMRNGEQVGWRSAIRLNGKRVDVYGKTKTEVARKLREVREKAEQGVRDPKKLPVGDYLVSEWLPHKKSKIDLRTWVGYEAHCRLHIVPAIGQVKLARLTSVDIQRMLDDLSDAGVNPRTVRHVWATLHNALGYAVKPARYLSENPAARDEGTGIVLPLIAESERPFLSLEEARRLVPIIRDHRLGPLYLTALMTGMREGELFGLRWRDVDLDEGWLVVQQTVWWHRDPGDLHQTPRFKQRPKNKRLRRVPLPAVVVDILREHRLNQARERDQAGAAYAKHHLVFSQLDGQPLRHTTALYQLRKLIQEAGVTHIGMHSLRHSAASIHIFLGANIKEVAEILGHSDTRITADLYGHLFDNATKYAADRMNDAVAGPVEEATPLHIARKQGRTR